LTGYQQKLEHMVEERTEKLCKSEEKFRVIFDQSPVGMSVINSASGQFTQINKKYCDLVGYTREEVLEGRFQNITHPDDLEADLDNMRKLISGEIHLYSMEKRYYHKNGSIIWVHLTVVPLWREGEKPQFHLAIVQDMTERREAVDKIRQQLDELQH